MLARTRAELQSKTPTIRVPDPQLHTVPLFATPQEAIAHFQALADAGNFSFAQRWHDAENQFADVLMLAR